jgi:diguanylate cyclase (GGDEF)-like protein
MTISDTEASAPAPLVTVSGEACGARVLLVEDSRAISMILTARIDAIDGLVCDAVTSYAAAEAVLAARAREYFVAVTDLDLPDARHGEIIDLVERHGLPIVVLTGTVDPAKRDAMYRRGVADYVVKDSLVGIDYVARLVSRMAHSQEATFLVVDDSRTFRGYMVSLLRAHGYPALTADDGEAGLAMLKAHPEINVVIADYNMPRMDGLQMVSEMRMLRSPDDLAIIAVSDSSKPDLLSRFLKHGASDYLHKPFAIEEFYCRIDQNVDMLRSVRRAMELANRDFLTGLYNRRYFFEHAGSLHQRARAGELKIALSMLDADHFKRINDHHGHQIGDEALKAIADTLRSRFDGRGLTARLGGEEFVFVSVVGRSAEARAVAEAVRGEIEAIDLRHGEVRVPLSVSVGTTSTLGRSLDDMLQRADDAVYEAKRAGRNRVVAV